MTYKDTKVLITGGAGYIGSHLCERLVEDGAHVFSLDNYHIGHPTNHIAGVTYVTGHTKDIFTHIPWSPDYIFHLGEYARVEQSIKEDFDTIFDLNIIGTKKILEFTRVHNAKIIYAGSSTRFTETESTYNATPYIWTKTTNAQLVSCFGAWYGIKHSITYFYNVFGGRERSGTHGTFIAILKDAYLRKQPLPIVLPGTQKRKFTHIDDIVSGLYLVGLHGSGDGYSIGHPNSYSVLEIAQLFNTEIMFLPERVGNRDVTHIDTQKTQSLGWSAKHSVVDHIEEFVKTHENTR